MTQTGLALISSTTLAATRRGSQRATAGGSLQSRDDFRRAQVWGEPASYDGVMAKRSEKPKKSLKKQPQKTLKERRSEKRAAKKFGSG